MPALYSPAISTLQGTVGGRTDMNVGARRRTCDCSTKRDERDSLGAQVGHQCLPLRTVGVDCDINRSSMVEAKSVVHFRLAKRTDRIVTGLRGVQRQWPRP